MPSLHTVLAPIQRGPGRQGVFTKPLRTEQEKQFNKSMKSYSELPQGKTFMIDCDQKCTRNVTLLVGWPLVRSRNQYTLISDVHCQLAFSEGMASQKGCYCMDQTAFCIGCADFIAWYLNEKNDVK